jgi:glutathione S-transferase
MPGLKKPIEDSLEMIERYLNEYEYVASSNMTIADFSMLPSGAQE